VSHYESEELMNGNERNEASFHGKFVPNDPLPLPLATRIAIGIGVGLLIFVMAMLCLNSLNHLGVWLTLSIISGFTAITVVLWVRDALLHPATVEDSE
jgi:hypothetical protein